MKSIEKRVKTFTDVLKKNIEDYDGVFSEFIQYVPDFYELFQSLLKESELAPNMKDLVSKIVSYFVLPDDVISEIEYGAFGYIDDLYLCAYAIHHMKNDHDARAVIAHLWNKDISIFELSEKIYNELHEIPEEIIQREELEQVENFIEDQIYKYRLFQNRIPLPILMHMNHKMAQYNILNPKQRKVFYKFIKMKMEGKELTEKQMNYLESLIEYAISEGIADLQCDDENCYKCKKLREIVKE